MFVQSSTSDDATTDGENNRTSPVHLHDPKVLELWKTGVVFSKTFFVLGVRVSFVFDRLVLDRDVS